MTALTANSQKLHLPNLPLPLTALYDKIAKEALKGAYWYQGVMSPGSDIQNMSVEDLLGVASIHYRRRPETDWSV